MNTLNASSISTIFLFFSLLVIIHKCKTFVTTPDSNVHLLFVFRICECFAKQSVWAFRECNFLATEHILFDKTLKNGETHKAKKKLHVSTATVNVFTFSKFLFFRIQIESLLSVDIHLNT